MNIQTCTQFLLLLYASCSVGNAQNVGGVWLGVTYPSNPRQAFYNYTMTLTQAGNKLSGTAQTANPQVPFGGLAYISGQVTAATVTFNESDQSGSTTVKNVCFWRGTMTYNPVDESMIGTYENIVNGTTCTDATGGKVELYRIVLKSGASYCRNTPINLLVTGKNIRWYDSNAKTNLLATGNSFSPQITQTTTFYITQTLYNDESPAVPITVTISEPDFKTTVINTACNKATGTIDVVASGAAKWQYQLNHGLFQSSPRFTDLASGSYTVVARDTLGCQLAQSVSLATESAPAISSIQPTPPHCETANGSVTLMATGGKSPLTYSIDAGASYQASPTFTRLGGGSYTVRVRDANGCEATQSVSLPTFTPMTVLSTTIVPTTCGQANGQAAMTVGGGRNPVLFAIDNRSFQAATLFIGLPPGSYTLVAKDSAGCTIDQTLSVAASTGPQINDIQTTLSACGEQTGTIRILPAAKTGNLTYMIDGQPSQRSADFSGLKDGTYTLTIQDDNNCQLTRTIAIASDCANRIHLPTAFSPNQDGQNDALTVHFTFPALRITAFIVYDRWGAVLYNRVNFALASGEPIWDGQLNGQRVPSGMYSYRLDCQFPDGTQSTYRQSVALLH